MLAQGDFDAVLISSPIHSDPAIAAAKAGKHVLVEKPMADNLAEAEAMVAAAEAAHVKLMLSWPALRSRAPQRYDQGCRAHIR